MEVEPGMRCRPGIHAGVLVGGVIVQDHMHGKPFRDPPINGAEEFENSSTHPCRHQPRADAWAGTARSPVRQHVQLLRRGPVSVRNAANSVVVPWRR